MARADEQSAARTAAVSILTPHTPVGSIPLLCRLPTSHHTPHSSCSVAHCRLWLCPQGAAFPNPEYLHRFLLMGDGASEFFCSEKQPAEHREMSSALLLQTTAPAPKKERNGEDSPLVSSLETCKEGSLCYCRRKAGWVGGTGEENLQFTSKSRNVFKFTLLDASFLVSHFPVRARKKNTLQSVSLGRMFCI